MSENEFIELIDKTICHIIPVGDSHSHSNSTSCKCNPNSIACEGLVIHNSFDKREIKEYLQLNQRLIKIEKQLGKCRTSTIQDGWQTQRFSKKSRNWDIYSKIKMEILSKIYEYEAMISVENNKCSICGDKCTQHSIKFNSCYTRSTFLNNLK